MLSAIVEHLGAGPVRYILGFLFLLNIRAFPLAWHVRVLWSYFAFHIQYWLHGLSIIYKSTSAKQTATQVWWDSRSPIGKSPFDLVLKYTDWSSPDVCDYNLHLSNSCYAKTLDTVRMKWVLAFVSQVFRVDGVLPVGGTPLLHFIIPKSTLFSDVVSIYQRIPMLRRFEVRCSVVTWGEKWLYLVAKFVTTGSRKVTPRAEDTTPSSFPGTPSDSDADLQQKVSDKLSEEPDEAVVHCVSISQVCFKIGRITVPPALVLALSGCSEGNYTRANPPPGYLVAQKIVVEGQAKDILKGRWKCVPKSERWWEEAFGESIEKIRMERLAAMEDIRLGMQREKAY
ncbi:hypothetical protein DFS33DRAFT_1326818 [Desarmillaria ectypa]|nr:hypothetical protein DFS33DRAFT_1326818 [Desarmillaria ectypa]